MASPPHPSRFVEIINMLKEEYERISSENAGYKGIRGDWSRKIEEQVRHVPLRSLVSCPSQSATIL